MEKQLLLFVLLAAGLILRHVIYLLVAVVFTVKRGGPWGRPLRGVWGAKLHCFELSPPSSGSLRLNLSGI
jgi:hypothetical protein